MQQTSGSAESTRNQGCFVYAAALFNMHKMIQKCILSAVCVQRRCRIIISPQQAQKAEPE